MIEIVLAGRPMGKERVKRGAAGNAYTPDRTVSFESRIAFEAQHVMAGRPLFEGPLHVEVVAVMPIPPSKPKRWQSAARAGQIMPTAKPDWDNIGKVLDGLNLIVWRDDAQIIVGGVTKAYGSKPLFAVRITPLVHQPALPAWVQKHVFDEEMFG